MEDLKMIKASTVLKTILNNGPQFGIHDLATHDLDSVKVEKVTVRAITYFELQGCGVCKYAYPSGSDIYFFRDKDQLVKAIEILLREGNPMNAVEMPLKLDILVTQ